MDTHMHAVSGVQVRIYTLNVRKFSRHKHFMANLILGRCKFSCMKKFTVSTDCVIKDFLA